MQAAFDIALQEMQIERPLALVASQWLLLCIAIQVESSNAKQRFEYIDLH